MNILVTDGENRSSLSITRSLGKKGYKIHVVGQHSPCLASSSRFCDFALKVPNPSFISKDYVDIIARIAYEQKLDFVIPSTEASIYQLNPYRNRLPEKTILACPPADMMQSVSDKFSLFYLAESLDIPVPKTMYLDTAEDLHSVIDDVSTYPVVIKPALSKIKEAEGFLSGGVMYANSRQHLEKLYTEKRILQYPSLIQERIIGHGTGLFTLFDKDRHLALFSHRRILEKPPSGGISVVSESVALDGDMVASAEKLLSAVGWKGVAMVEFKRDNGDGRAKLMEINGRFWGSLQLAITCGIDFPGLYLDYMQGIKPDKTMLDYNIGHKMKWILGSLDHLLIRLRNESSKLNLPPECPSTIHAVKNLFMIGERNSSYDVLDREDMKPFLHEIKIYLRQVFRGN